MTIESLAHISHTFTPNNVTKTRTPTLKHRYSDVDENSKTRTPIWHHSLDVHTSTTVTLARLPKSPPPSPTLSLDNRSDTDDDDNAVESQIGP